MKDEEQPASVVPPKPKSDPVGRVIYGILTALIFIPLVLFVVNWLTLNDRPSVPATDHAPMASTKHGNLSADLPGSLILKNYATETQPPQQDLTDIFRVFGNFALLVKGDQPLPLGANEEIAAALRGKNRTQLRFLPDQAPCFNAQGQIVDRWQTPLFFHAEDKDRIDIRSAGPDRQMWTADDIHRHYDGQFVRGAALNATSLMDATRDYRGK